MMKTRANKRQYLSKCGIKCYYTPRPEGERYVITARSCLTIKAQFYLAWMARHNAIVTDETRGVA